MKKNTRKYSNTIAYSRWVILVCLWWMPLLAPAAENTAPIPAESVAAGAVPAVAADASAAPVAASITASSAASIAAYKPVPPASAKTSTTSQLANLIGGLALILVLIYGLSWFVKRFTQGGFMQNSSIKMLASLPLGTRERLMLVEVGGKQILLGVTAAQINSLHVFDEQLVQAVDNKTDKSAIPAASDFSQKLMTLLQQKNSGKTDSSEHKNIK